MAASEATLGRRSWPALLAATVTTVVAVAAIWLDAEPREIVCPAIYPALEGCTPEARRAAAVAWTVVLILLYMLSATLFTVGRWRRATGPTLLGLVVMGFFAYQGVLGSTGHVIW